MRIGGVIAQRPEGDEAGRRQQGKAERAALSCQPDHPPESEPQARPGELLSSKTTELCQPAGPIGQRQTKGIVPVERATDHPPPASRRHRVAPIDDRPARCKKREPQKGEQAKQPASHKAGTPSPGERPSPPPPKRQRKEKGRGEMGRPTEPPEKATPGGQRK